MDSFDLESFFPYRLAVLSSRISAGFAEIYGKEFGISQPEWRVIAHLSQSGKVSVREIHQRVDMDKSKVSRAAAKLEAAGIVEKKTNPADKRLVEMSLTGKGRKIVSRIAPLAREYEASVLASLPDDLRTEIQCAVDKLLKDKQ